MTAHEFVPYANEADVVNIGKLVIENRVDRITICGDIDLTLDQAGLVQARQLWQLLGAVVATLEALALPETLPAPLIKTVANPFD